MSGISLKNVTLNFPIYGANARFLKHRLLSFATGGRLTKIGGHVTVSALTDINLQLNAGDRLGVIGHNGAGKSTLLKTISGVYHPQQGSVTIEGQVSALLELDTGMEYEATGYENVFLRGYMLGFSRAAIKKNLDDIVEFTELHDYMHLPIKTYSSGMKLRLAFAISTAFFSDVLIIDEVIATGDAHFKAKALQRIENLIKQSKIFVLSTHEEQMIKRFCNKVVWLEQGKLRAFGDVDAVLTEYMQVMAE